MSAHTKHTNKVSLSSINCFWINIRSFRGQVCLYLNFHKSKTQYNVNINRSVWFPGFPLQAWKVIYFSFLVWWHCYCFSAACWPTLLFCSLLKKKNKKTPSFSFSPPSSLHSPAPFPIFPTFKFHPCCSLYSDTRAPFTRQF